MASRNVKLKIETQLQKKALNDAVKGIRDVDKAMEKSGKTSVKMSNEGVKANKRNSYAAGQAAMQLQDVAVQAQMGTDSMRILGQQGPQLLSAFGPKGMLAGLAVAVGAGLVSAFRQPKKELGELIEEIERMVSTGKDIQTLHSDRLTDSLSATIKRANQARDAFLEMMQTREQSEQKALSATDALIEAELALRKLKGEDVSLEEEQLKSKQAQRKIEEDKNRINNEAALKRQEQLETEKRITAELEAQEVSIGAARAENQGRQDVLEAAMDAEKETRSKATGGFLSFGRGAPTKGQEKKLEDAEIALQAAQSESEKAKASLRVLLDQREVLRQSLEEAQSAIALTAETIEEGISKTELTAKARSVNEAANSMGKQLKILEGAFAEGTEAIKEGAPKNVIARIKDIISDGITTDELEELVRLTNQLGIKLNQGFGAQNQTMKGIVGQLEFQLIEVEKLKSTVLNLKSQQKTPLPR